MVKSVASLTRMGRSSCSKWIDLPFVYVAFSSFVEVIWVISMEARSRRVVTPSP